MYLQSSPSRNKRRRCAALVLFVLLLFQTTAVAADAIQPVPRSMAPVRRAAVPALVAGWSLTKAFSYVETALGSQRRMIQLATLGMCIGLYILMRR